MSGEHDWGPRGALVLVATPIGHLGEASPRARTALAAASAIYAEDTRRTRQLLAHFDITGVALRSLHEHNEADRRAEVVDRVSRGDLVVLVTDAGMPGVSDPGAAVVDAVAAAGGRVSVVSGPSAVISAVAIAGFGGDRFVFEGFLPRGGRDRTERIAGLMDERRSVVVFESPRRVRKTLRDLAAVDPDRRAVVARELSKLHEDVWRGTLGELAERAEEAVRGEIVLVIAPPTTPVRVEASARDIERLADEVNAAVARGAKRSVAAADVAARSGAARGEVYAASLRRSRGSLRPEAGVD